MVVKEEVIKLVEQLISFKTAVIQLSGFPMHIQVFDGGTGLSFTTPVYCGGNFIPNAVRGSLLEIVPFSNPSLNTRLHIDEECFQVLLIYKGRTALGDHERFVIVLEEFHQLAEEWRLFLDETDRNDRVYARS